MIYFTSDIHFSHSAIIRYSNRPYSSIEEMDEALISNWNSIVKPNDEIWHLGDFAFCNSDKLESIIRRLNGRKGFVIGNHDKELIKALKQTPSLASEGIQHYKEIKQNGVLYVLFHYGQRVWNKSHYGSIHLFGHSHGTLPPYGKSVDVGVDAKFITEEYRPVSIDEINEFMKNKKYNIEEENATIIQEGYIAKNEVWAGE